MYYGYIFIIYNNRIDYDLYRYNKIKKIINYQCLLINLQYTWHVQHNIILK